MFGDRRIPYPPTVLHFTLELTRRSAAGAIADVEPGDDGDKTHLAVFAIEPNEGRLDEVARLFVPFIRLDNAPPALERCRKRTGFLPRHHAVSANSFGSRTRL
jgi:hypothetical protein